LFFLLPHPGLDVTEADEYDGSAHLLRPNFRENLVKLVDFTLKPEHLVVKRINGVDITCKDLFKYLTIYLKMYQDPNELPEPKTALQATAEANNVSAKERALSHYNREMQLGTKSRYLSKKHFETLHINTKDGSLEHFDKIKKLGGKEYSGKFREELGNDIEKAKSKFQELNDAKASVAGLKTPVCLIFLLLIAYILSHEYIDTLLSVIWLSSLVTFLEGSFWVILLSLLGYTMIKIGNIENDLVLNSLVHFDVLADFAWDNGLSQAGQMAVTRAVSMGFTPSNMIVTATTGKLPDIPPPEDD